MEIDIFKIPQIIQKPIIALLFIQNDYWLKKKKQPKQLYLDPC